MTELDRLIAEQAADDKRRRVSKDAREFTMDPHEMNARFSRDSDRRVDHSTSNPAEITAERQMASGNLNRISELLSESVWQIALAKLKAESAAQKYLRVSIEHISEAQELVRKMQHAGAFEF